MVYLESPQHLLPEQLTGFFVGWPRPPYVVLAFDEESEKVVGCVTAISDGVLSAYVPLLEVLPEHQGRGIGTELMRRMLDKLIPFPVNSRRN